ncbi:MAG: thiamine-phosphate kinase, partial [Pseudomonadota bacterium]
DAGHIAYQSKAAIDLYAEKIPLSEAAQSWLSKAPEADAAIAQIASFGDDYEILFTAPASRRRSIEMASQVTKTPVARIGAVGRGKGVRLLNAKGAEIPVPRAGFDHFKA